MNHHRTLTFSFLALLCFTASYGQRVTTDIYSGVNFSSIHGEEPGGKWKSKPGPVQGFNLGYNFTKSLGFQTGLSFTTIYYEHKSPSTIYYPLEYYLTNSQPYDIIAPPYYYTSDKMDFRYIRMPFLLKVSIPSTLNFSMRAGIYLGFLQDNNLTESSPGVNKAKKDDFGYIFSSGILYPVSENIEVGLNVNYVTGRRHILETSAFRNGSSEFALTFDYEFLKKSKQVKNASAPDTSKKVTVTYRAGLNMSWNGLDEERSRYSSLAGPSLGFNINFDLGYGFSFITGVSFERKGYSMKDSSELYYRYLDRHHKKSYVDSKVQIDYAVIPLIMRIPIGKSEKIFVNTGPWLGLKLNSRNVGEAYTDNRQISSYTLIKTVIYDDFDKYIKDTDIGWLINAQVSLPVFNKYKVDLALQYSIGFDDVFNSSLLPATQDPFIVTHVIRNRTLSFVLGFTLP